MKKRLHGFRLVIIALTVLLGTERLNAQACHNAQTNWDRLDYYWNSGSNLAPYGFSPGGNYVTDAQEMSQKFGIGANWFTITTSSAALVNPGAGNAAVNGTHTGDLANYTGDDLQYNPTAGGQNIVINFNAEVRNVSFSIYDLDGNGVITLTSTGSGTLTQTISNTGSNLSVGGVATARIITSTTGSDLGNASNNGSFTLSIPGPVKTITITVTTPGSNPVFWLSDINACISQAFPTTKYHQLANNRPFVGPTQNQADYFLVTPDSDSTYYVDPLTGHARFLFRDNTRDYVNGFAYDPYNRFLYYVQENVSIDASNHRLMRWNFNTNASEEVMADMETTLGIPIMSMGVESAGAAFYNGQLYFGIEGGRHGSGGGTVTRKSIVWRIDFNGSNVPINAVQVWATEAYTNGTNTSIHDWGDFIVKDSTIYDFNTARSGTCGTCYAQSKYHHYNMTTGVETVFTNPSTTQFTGQTGLTWDDRMWWVRDSVGLYNGNGTNNPAFKQRLQIVDGPYTWPGGAGDASDPFRPALDFGDAPATYDPYVTPATQSPAVHERTDSIRIGATWDREYLKKGVNGTADTDDGLVFVPILTPGGNFYPQVRVYNNSGAPARLIAWLDFNANGVFDAAEAITPISVPSSTSTQLFYLTWLTVSTPLVPGQFTYMRIRITSQSAGMTSAHATGFFLNGEVEDYRVNVDNFPLAVTGLSFNARLGNDNAVKLAWSANEDQNFGGYEIERSTDANQWQHLDFVAGNGQSGIHSYDYTDVNPLRGTSYYRLRISTGNGAFQYSEVKTIRISKVSEEITLLPNPAKVNVQLTVTAQQNSTVEVRMINAAGKTVYTQNHQLNNGVNAINLALAKYPAGTYVVQVLTTDGEIINKRLLINR